MSILVVDDAEDGRRLLKSCLSYAGYRDVLTVPSAEAAFAMLGLDGDLPGMERPHVEIILMDIVMPGVDGIAALRRIKGGEAYGDVPVVMVTAASDVEMLEKAFSAGATDYIAKPVRTVELLARVGAALALKEERDKRKQREVELLEKNKELEMALREIKVLQGLIPICSYCKKIRDDEGLWQQIEAYITKHSEATFTHGVCETCAKKYFPDN